MQVTSKDINKAECDYAELPETHRTVIRALSVNYDFSSGVSFCFCFVFSPLVNSS